MITATEEKAGDEDDEEHHIDDVVQSQLCFVHARVSVHVCNHILILI